MKVYKIELLIVDHDDIGEEIKSILENARYPNHCIGPKVMNMEEREIGEWEDNNPLNQKATCRQEYNRLFGITNG